MTSIVLPTVVLETFWIRGPLLSIPLVPVHGMQLAPSSIYFIAMGSAPLPFPFVYCIAVDNTAFTASGRMDATQVPELKYLFDRDYRNINLDLRDMRLPVIAVRAK